jgi:hypothetical protein
MYRLRLHGTIERGTAKALADLKAHVQSLPGNAFLSGIYPLPG